VNVTKSKPQTDDSQHKINGQQHPKLVWYRP